MPHPPGGLLRIGDVASRSGLSVKTIRFYCDEGLLEPSMRSESRYRLFGEEVFGELALLRRLRAMDLPLAEVASVLRARRSGVCTCTRLQSTIKSKVDEVETRLHELSLLKQELEELLQHWTYCGGSQRGLIR